MAYKIGDKNSQAIISEDQDGQFGTIRIHSTAQLVIGENYRPFDAVPPSYGTVAAYFSGGTDGVTIPTPQAPIQDPAKSYPTSPFSVIPQVGFSSNYNDIQKFSFSAPEGSTATTVGELTSDTGFYQSVGLSTNLSGYHVGGGSRRGAQLPTADYYPYIAPLDGDHVNKFSFASQTNSYVSGGDLQEPRFTHVGADSPAGYNKGIIRGGYNFNPFGPASTTLTTMEKINFASETSAALGTGSGPTTTSHGMSAQSDEYAYWINGLTRVDNFNDPSMPPGVYPNQSVTYGPEGTHLVERTSWASEVPEASSIDTDLTPARYAGTGVSSLDHAYIAGGFGFGSTYRSVQAAAGYPQGVGQVQRDRQPGSTNALWAPPDGSWNTPTNTFYPGFVPAYSNPITITGSGKGFGWFANYSITNHYYGAVGSNHINFPAENIIEELHTWPPTDVDNPDGAKWVFNVNFSPYNRVGHEILHGGVYTTSLTPALPSSPVIGPFGGPMSPGYTTNSSTTPASPSPGVPSIDMIVERWQEWDAPILESGFTIDKFPFAVDVVSTDTAEFTNHGVDFHDFGGTGTSGGNPGYNTFYWNRLGLTGASSGSRGYLAGGAGHFMGPGILLQTGSTGNMAPKVPLMVGGSPGDSNTHTSMITSFPFSLGFSGNTTDVGNIGDDNHGMAGFQD